MQRQTVIILLLDSKLNKIINIRKTVQALDDIAAKKCFSCVQENYIFDGK